MRITMNVEIETLNITSCYKTNSVALNIRNVIQCYTQVKSVGKQEKCQSIEM